MLSVFCGCDDSFYTITYPEPVIVHPDAETAQTINGYRAKSSSMNSSSKESVSSSVSVSTNESIDDVDLIYYGNKSTKKFHLHTCRYAKNMDSAKRVIFESYQIAISKGYFPCKVCQKEE